MAEEEVKRQEEKKEGGKGTVAFAAMFGPPALFFALVILFGGPRKPTARASGPKGLPKTPAVENWDKVCEMLDTLVSRTRQFAIKAQANGEQWGWPKMGKEYEEAAERLEKVVEEIKSTGNFDYHALWDVAKELRKLAHAPYKQYQTQKAAGEDPNRGLLRVSILYVRGCMQIYTYMVKCLEALGVKREGSKGWDFERDFEEACKLFQTLNRE